jgi:hypothetical protein
MPFEYPSDRREVPLTNRSSDVAATTSPLTLGEARDILNSPWAVLRPRKLLTIARGLSEMVHNEIDYTTDGYLKLLPEEIKRRAIKSNEFLEMTPTEFPLEDQRLFEEG